uniref:Uncharacterized protein n=1 Tax=Anguilla anguilla TaxID=7936 RepID=A0A0E9TDP7_ANGAN
MHFMKGVVSILDADWQRPCSTVTVNLTQAYFCVLRLAEGMLSCLV